jgi:hypothetical protein
MNASPSSVPAPAQKEMSGLASFKAAQKWAERFHESYERLAPDFGYTTRPETRAFDLQSANGRLMVAVCQELLSAQKVESGYKGPAKFTPEEAADGDKGIRWVTETHVAGRPPMHDVLDYIERRGEDIACSCHRCKEFAQKMESAEGVNSDAKDAAMWRWLVAQHNVTSGLPIAQVVWKRGGDPYGEWVNLIDGHDLIAHVERASSELPLGSAEAPPHLSGEALARTEERIARMRANGVTGLDDGQRNVHTALRRLISDDAYAMTFQTMGQYRAALLKAIDAAAAAAAGVKGLDRG